MGTLPEKIEALERVLYVIEYADKPLTKSDIEKGSKQTTITASITSVSVAILSCSN